MVQGTNNNDSRFALGSIKVSYNFGDMDNYYKIVETIEKKYSNKACRQLIRPPHQ